jgi:aldehyde dehydrogenase (NAD+)
MNLSREEEPQISVPMFDIFVSYPGATAEEVERRIVNVGERTNVAGSARFAKLLEGQRIHTGGQVDVATRYVAPTIVLDPPLDSELMQEEIFGPVLPIITVDEMHHAIKFVADRPKPLALYLFTKSKALEDAVLDKLSAGSVCINDAVIFMVSPELPFGGIGNSGMGRYTGWYGFETFSHMKPVMKRSFRFDAPMRYPPYSDFKRRIMELVR